MLVPGRGCPEVNKVWFEQVSSNGNHMSLAGAGARAVGGPISDVRGSQGQGSPVRCIQCIMGNGHMGPHDRQTD